MLAFWFKIDANEWPLSDLIDLIDIIEWFGLRLDEFINLDIFDLPEIFWFPLELEDKLWKNP